jgi:hypothetical protein
VPRRSSDPPPLKLVLLLVLGAVGLALVAVGVGTTYGWKLIVPGALALLVSLPAVWFIQKSRDKTLR